jgi:HSP20 family protein
MPPLPFSKDIPLSLGELQREMNRLFDHFWHGGITTGPLDGNDWAPPVDIVEDEDRFMIKAEVPGLDASDIEVSVSDNAITLKGHKATDHREGDERNTLQAERRFGSFFRTITLPVTVDPSSVTANCRKGVLEISLGKKEEHRPKTITVEVSD